MVMGEYIVVDKIGAGGTGAKYSKHNTAAMMRTVAIKVLPIR